MGDEHWCAASDILLDQTLVNSPERSTIASRRPAVQLEEQDLRLVVARRRTARQSSLETRLLHSLREDEMSCCSAAQILA